MVTVDAVGLALRVPSPRLVEQQGSRLLLLAQTVLVCSTQTPALDPESFRPTPSPAPLTESPGGLGKASVDGVGLGAAVPAELRQKRLGGGAAQLFPHLCTHRHGIPASMLCTERHSGGQKSHVSRLSASHLKSAQMFHPPVFPVALRGGIRAAFAVLGGHVITLFVGGVFVLQDVLDAEVQAVQAGQRAGSLGKRARLGLLGPKRLGHAIPARRQDVDPDPVHRPSAVELELKESETEEPAETVRLATS